MRMSVSKKRLTVLSLAMLGFGLPVCLVFRGMLPAWPRSSRYSPPRAVLGERKPTTDLPLAFNPEGRTLASGRRGDSAIRLWDVATGVCLDALEVSNDDVTSLSFSPDGATLAVGLKKSGGTALELWKMSPRKQQAAFKGKGVSCLAFSPDGKTLACGCAEKTIRLWDLPSGTNALTLDAWGIVSVAFSPDGKTLASASIDGSVKLWSLASGQKTPLFQWMIGPWGEACSVAFSPDGTALAAGGATDLVSLGAGGGCLRLWDLASRQERVIFGAGNLCQNIQAIAFSPDGTTLASGSRDGQVLFWDASTGKLKATMWHDGSEVLTVAFSPDGKLLASGSDDGHIKLWQPPDAR
jgi:WD40 repeat protein